MEIKSLSLSNFRIYTKGDFSFNPVFNFILGENAAGKTTLLEAISILLSGRSFKKASDTDIIQNKQESYQLGGKVQSDLGTFYLHLSYDLKSKMKKMSLDRKNIQSFKDLLSQFPFVSFLSKDTKLILEGPALRRQFFDRMISYIDSSYYESLIRFNRVLKQRNELLKKKQTQMIEYWDEEFAKLSSFVSKTRLEYVEYFNAEIQKFSDLPKHLNELHFTYSGEVNEGNLLKSLKENLEKDTKRGYSSKGAQRDDFVLRFHLGELKNFASQGQIKALSFYLKLFEAFLIYRKTSKKPVLLIDDIFAELDLENRKKILNQIKLTGFQSFIASTTEDFVHEFFEQSSHKLFFIEQGEVINEA